MSKIPKAKTKLHSWAISHIKRTPAARIGHVEAPDSESAIQEAIRQFKITDPAQQERLAARRVRWPPAGPDRNAALRRGVAAHQSVML
jgi:hypothetical protein